MHTYEIQRTKQTALTVTGPHVTTHLFLDLHDAWSLFSGLVAYLFTVFQEKTYLAPWRNNTWFAELSEPADRNRYFLYVDSGTQDRGFAPGRSRRIFSGEKISVCLPSEGK
jgi:hypothetical protein